LVLFGQGVLLADAKEEFKAELESIKDNFRQSIESCVHSHAPSLKANITVTSGVSFIEIIRHVGRHQYDLVVKCAEDIDWLERMLGSDDMHLLRKCPCPVLMLKPGHNETFKKILATVDVNDDVSESVARTQEELNDKVLEHSATLSLPELTELHIGSAWEAYAESFLRHGGFSSTPEETINQYVEQERRDCLQKLDALVRKMNELLGKDTVQYLHPRSHLVKGKPSKQIPLLVENYGIDLIVMGTVGRVGIPGLVIGNTAEAILEQTQCSVLAIKPEGFKTPVA